jgi:hypothetical protein
VPNSPPYPSGVPLTDVMEFTAGDGTSWLVYIEAIPLPPPRRWRSPTLLPARRLRFDAVSESRIATPVPAGAPFLTEVRLQTLLDQAIPLGLWDLGAVSREDRQRWLARTRTHAGLAVAAVAGVALAESGRRWKQAAEHHRTIRSRSEAFVAAATDRAAAWVSGLLKGQPRARL